MERYNSSNKLNKTNILKRPERTPLENVVPLETPYVIYIDPCGACNFECSFCPCNHSDYRIQERHEIMSWHVFKKIVDDIAEFPEKIRVIDLYAFGEPLLNPNIIKMIKYLKQKNVCNEIFMVSNGSLLTPDLCRDLASSGLDLYRVSLEALSNKGYSEFANRKGIFTTIVQNLRSLHDAAKGTGLRIEVKTVDTVLDSPEAKERFEDIFTPISDFLRVENVGQIWSEYNAYSSNEEVTNKGMNLEICSRPFFQMAIHSNGDVSTCCADWKLKTVYGNVKESSLHDLWNSDRLKKIQMIHASGKRNNIEFCRDCEFKSPDIISSEAGMTMYRNIKKHYKEAIIYNDSK